MRKLLHAVILVSAALPALALAQTRAPAPPYPGAPPEQPGAAPQAPVRRPPAVLPGNAPPPAPAAVPPRPAQPAAAAPSPSRRPAAGAAAATPAPGAEAGNAGGDARADGRCTPMQGRFLLAFNKADIVDVLEQASRWTCRNFAYTDDIARGKITLLSKTPVTAEEAYAAFLAALTANNIAVYPSGRYYKLVRIADAKKTPIPTIADGAEVPALEQPVTKIFKLHYADPDQLRGIMGNFTSPQGADIQSIPPDTLIVTDIGLNIRRIERLLDALDKPGSGELIRFIQVRYASARDLADKVNQIFQQSGPTQPGRPGRRPVIGGVAPTPGAPAPVAAVGEEGGLSISKVMADERTNKLVVIADDKSFNRIRDLVDQLDVPTAGEGQIHVVFMKNASAEDLAQSLQALAQGTSARKTTGPGTTPTPVQPFQPQAVPGAPAGAVGATTAALFSGEVKITADKVANALLILASGSDFATVQRLIEKLDIARRQVFVEAVILEVNLNDETQLGVGMHAAIPFKTSDGTGFIPLTSEPNSSLNSLNPLSAVSLGGFLSGLVGPTSPQLQGTVLAGFPSIGFLVQALQTSSDVNVISTPHILATDNEDAEITVGQNVPFQAGVISPGLSSLASTASTTGTTGTTNSLAGFSGLLGSVVAPIQRQNVELRLRIKPQITEGDNIRLQIDEQNEDIASRDPQLGPTTNKRTIKTNISVKDQSTIVIGGLIQERTIQGVRKIPLLGDIPLLGWLFRSTDNTKTKTNLLLFLTPYIIHDQSDYRRIYERKRAEQQEFLQAFYGEKSKYEPTVEYERKTGPYTKIRKDVETETLKLENGGPGAPGEGAVSPRGRVPPPADQGRPAPPASPPSGTAPPATPRGASPSAPPGETSGTPAATPSKPESEPAPPSSGDAAP